MRLRLVNFACVLLFVANVGLIFSAGVGKCPKIDYMPNFDLNRFLGNWHEIERSFYLIELLSSCVNVNIEMNNTKTPAFVEVSVVSKTRWSGSQTVSEGFATITKRDPSVFLYKVTSKLLPKVVLKYLPGAGMYQVVSTDYDNYAILWSCTNYGLAHTDLVWIWGRQKEFNVTLRQKVYHIMAEKHIDAERLILPNNKNCTD